MMHPQWIGQVNPSQLWDTTLFDRAFPGILTRDRVQNYDSFEFHPCTMIRNDGTPITPQERAEGQHLFESGDGMNWAYEQTEGNDPNIAVWTLYGHIPKGGIESVMDFETEEQALLALTLITPLERIEVSVLAEVYFSVVVPKGVDPDSVRKKAFEKLENNVARSLSNRLEETLRLDSTVGYDPFNAAEVHVAEGLQAITVHEVMLP